MRALLQRVDWARVRVAGEIVGEIEKGLLILLGVGQGDDEATADFVAQKTAELRIFADDADKMNLSLRDVAGGALVVSQFTLYADSKKGRRPFFGSAAAPERASALCDHFVRALQGRGIEVATGRFGAMMEVELQNAGPVTIMLDSAELR